MDKICVRVNGRGNAWPVQLGKTHPFYDRNRFEDLSNASFSIISEHRQEIKWSVLIDGGHGAIQYLLKNENRIPEAIIITHPHHDHIYSIDWVIQSYYRTHNKRKKYPVYATHECFAVVLTVFPHLEEMIDFKPLHYSVEQNISEIAGMSCTAFPVYHGVSAKGAAMLMFKIEKRKIIFTGDILCPLLNAEDYKALHSPEVIYVDCNNRFPYPLSNHWSIVPMLPDLKKKSNHLSEFLEEFDDKILTVSHNLKCKYPKENLDFSIIDFARKIDARNIQGVHYSGNEDYLHYGEKILSAEQLQNWLNELDKRLDLKISFNVPNVGEKYYIG